MDVFHPANYTVDHSLSGVQSHTDLEIAHMWFTQSRDCAQALRNHEIAHMWFTQSRDCAQALCNHEIAHTCYTIPRLPAQSRDSENAQRDLKIAQIPRLRGTYTLLCAPG